MRAIILISLLLILTISTTNSQSCDEWCNALFNTTFITICGNNNDFADVAACLNYCNSTNMTLGNTTTAAATGNTVGCRIYHAGVAMTSAPGNDHCKHASQTGGGVCGSYCDVYCDLVQKGACKGMFGSDSDCKTACALFPTNGSDINTSSPSAWGDHVQCRIYHAGAPATASSVVHCPHAYVTGGKACASNSDYCVGYCRMFISSCGATRAPPAYAAVDSCVRVCKGYAMLAPPSYMNQTGYKATDYTVATMTDSVDCRAYHAVAAISAPAIHCGHASLDGEGVCGNQCGVYCNLRNLQNTTCANFNINVSASTCMNDCNALNKTGSYLTSLGDDTVQCRLYHWAAVMGVQDTVHCAHGNIVGSATCKSAITSSTSGTVGTTGTTSGTSTSGASTSGTSTSGTSTSGTSTSGTSTTTSGTTTGRVTTGAGAVTAVLSMIVFCLAAFL